MNDLSIGTVPNSAEPKEIKKKEKPKPKEIVVTSDDADFIYEIRRTKRDHQTGADRALHHTWRIWIK